QTAAPCKAITLPNPETFCATFAKDVSGLGNVIALHGAAVWSNWPVISNGVRPYEMRILILNKQVIQ
ncbi:MAG: hypothetical protein AAFW82_09130, partial [Pseudomonadota bacterium]